jgi:hypothetical protein
MTVRLFGAVYDFIRPGAGKSNVPLQLAPDGPDPIIEFRCDKLSGPSLHFPDSFLKIVHTRADAPTNSSVECSRTRRFTSTILMAGSLTSSRIPCLEASSPTIRFTSTSAIFPHANGVLSSCSKRSRRTMCSRDL